MPDQIMEAASKLQQAERMRQAGNLTKAQKLCEELIKVHPDYYAALHTLGLIFADRGKFSSALFYLAQANAYYPENPATLIALGTVYFQLDSRDLAIRVLEEAATLTHDNPLLLMTLAETLKEDREYESAIEAYQKTLSLDPTWLEASIGLSQAYQAIGQYEASSELLLGLFQRGELSLSLASGLASLPQIPEAIDFPALVTGLAAREKNLTGSGFTRLQFLYFNVHHRAQAYEKAWEYLVQANALKCQKKGMIADRQKNTRWQKESLAATQAAPLAPCSETHPTTSLFILGPSRSGKTTVETLLGQLPEVKRGYENPIAINALRRAFRQAGLISSTQFALLPEKLNAACRGFYIEELERRASNAKVFTNTVPARIHDVFRLIHMIPEAKFLFVKRNEKDLVANIFAKEYKTGNFYAYDLKEIQQHVRWYNTMIDLLQARYPEHTAVIHYEQLIANPSILNAPVAHLTGINASFSSEPIAHNTRFCAPYEEAIDAVLGDE